jgi:hypothetical protein
MSMRRPISPNQVEVVDNDVADVLRKNSPAERIQMAADANDTARLIIAAGIRYCNPRWPEDQIYREVARRMLGAAD